MKNLIRLSNLTCWLAISLLSIPADEITAQTKKMSSQELTEVSTAVLYGKCKEIKCEWNENRSAIFTYVTITPEDYIKGSLGSEVVVMVPGGRVGDIVYEVSETPIFIEDEEVVAFIWKNPKGKNLITGGHQGKKRIEKDAKTGKRSVADPDFDSSDIAENQAPGQIKKAQKMELEDYLTKLKGYMKH